MAGWDCKNDENFFKAPVRLHSEKNTTSELFFFFFFLTCSLRLLLLDIQWHPDDSPIFTDDLGWYMTTFPDPLLPQN